MTDNLAHSYNERRVLTIDDLSDDDLLEIFNFYVVKYQYLGFYHLHEPSMKREIESWQSLVHVCRQWRGLVFGSPRRLNLQLYYHHSRTSERNTLDVWPALPILIRGLLSKTTEDNVIAGFEHSDRIREIDLYISTISQLEKLRTAMQVTFPELASLYLAFNEWTFQPMLPNSFLGGSAPRLQYLYLNTISFPGLPKLLLSATHLVNLYLYNIPHSGYISPEAMATSLSMLNSLESLQLVFNNEQLFYSHCIRRSSCPPTRSVLPTLKIIRFKGVIEYLEEFVARIDAPQLYQLFTELLEDRYSYTPEFIQFISRTPTLGAYDEAHLTFYRLGALVRLSQSPPEPSESDNRMVEVKFLSQVSDRQLSTLAKICTLSLRLLLTVENLYIDTIDIPLAPRDDSDNTKWLDLLLPFTAVKNLYLSEQLVPRIALALQELTEGRTMEVFPALQSVFLEGFQPSESVEELEGIAQFISARQLTNHPVAIFVWEGFLMRDKW